MDTSLALIIIGAVSLLIGTVFNALPIPVNQKIMGDLHEAAVRPAASIRTMTGAFAMAIGVTALYCRNLPAEEAGTLLTGLGIGYIILLVTLVLTKVRGLLDHLPVPPMIIFAIFIFLAFYAK
ncbi:MAG: hypothetical protein U9N31_01665 [Candidatus Marinimicrobia bacterium]|nr:hypothetical protein [Candidatus Neomarinimicrobiota bacterium]